MFKLNPKLFLGITVLLISLRSRCSDSTNIIYKKNVLFITFATKENFGSINYEHIFKEGNKLNWSYSVGIQPFDIRDKFSLPVSINTFTKGSLHHLELELTATFFMDKFHPYDGGWKDDFNKQLYLSSFACYRFQKSSGIVFKTGVGPQILLDPPSDNILQLRTRVLQPSVFASLGISF